MKLQDRVALITGAGSGFGRTTALMMAPGIVAQDMSAFSVLKEL